LLTRYCISRRPKFTAQGLRKVKETGWTPLQFLAAQPTRSKTVLEPVALKTHKDH